MVSLSTKPSKSLVCLKWLKIGRMPNKINGTGIMLPTNPRIVECRGDKPNAIPAGIAPLNSITGSIARISTVNLGPK